MISFHPFTSVTRWLLVVIGCVVLATAQPMSAADTESSAPTSPTPPLTAKSDLIIYPKAASTANGSIDGKTVDTTHSYVLIVAVLLAAAGAWVLFQRRRGGPLVARGPRKLQLEETKSLGNRQYLVVANYEGRKFLLGVTTGQIQMLAHLEEGEKKP